MKSYVICSDIHGSITTFKKVVDFFLINKFDQLIILGDLLYHGPRNDIPKGYNPKEVINLINPLKDKVIMVRGNCEAEVDQMVLDFKINDDYTFKYNSHNIYLTHGHHVNYLKPKSFDEKTIILHGHTHIIRQDKIDNNIYVNIGSITLPKENTSRCYAILDDNKITVYDINDNELLTIKL